MSRFENKVVLVSGGGTGIGREIAASFVREGAKVAVAGRRTKPLQALAAELGEAVLPVSGDITRPADRKRIVATVVEQFGRLDVLVNNAGVFLAKPLVETTDEELELLFSVNVLGLLALTREALPHLGESRGAVVNVSSTVSAGVMPGTVPYSATKAAVDHATRVLAAEVGALGVRVNAVAPGLTQTEMAKPLTEDAATLEGVVSQTPLGRVGLPTDIAPVTLFLASEEAGWVTGQIVQSSGGLML